MGRFFISSTRVAQQPLFLKLHHLFQDQSEHNEGLEINLTYIQRSHFN